jgi:hypothetical protein
MANYYKIFIVLTKETEQVQKFKIHCTLCQLVLQSYVQQFIKPY